MHPDENFGYGSKVTMVSEHSPRSQHCHVAIHGNKSQTARTQTLTKFKSGAVQILIATDMAASGLDIESILHVINYDLPNEPKTYIHRIGRTARVRSNGIAFSFCSTENRDYLRHIEKLRGKPVAINTGQVYHCKLARTATGANPQPPQSSSVEASHPKHQRTGTSLTEDNVARGE